MSPRNKKIRKVVSPPPVKGFRPFGGEAAETGKESVMMHFEEYESLRLCDYDLYNHNQASLLMGISRPTFTRIYASARGKIALALVEGRQISIEGGKVYFDSDWYHCSGCNCYFNNPLKENTIESCPLCGSKQFEGYEIDSPEQGGNIHKGEDRCFCPGCGFEKDHKPGIPCSKEICPECSAKMRRKGTSFHGNRRRGQR